MTFHKYPTCVQKEKYGAGESLEARYGLPIEVRFCRQCVMSNQRPNSAVEYLHTAESKKGTIEFDAEGVCAACNYTARKKQEIDWSERELQLLSLCNRYRKSDGSYDCIVPGSGGKDSFFASHVLKYKYGMHPLTVTWAPHIYTDWGWRNFQSWIHAGFDNILFTPNGRVHRLLTRLATENLFHPFQPFILGQKFIAARAAIAYNIPLVFYGESEAEYGNPLQETTIAQRDPKYFSTENCDEAILGGEHVSDLVTNYGIQANDLSWYLPPHRKQIQDSEIQVHYLGYYLPWHPQGCYYYAVDHGGFQPSPERTPGTYSKYNSIDDRIDDLHYYTTFIKFGIGRASYDAAQEIRSGELTREEGVALVRKFDGEFPSRFCSEIFKYLSIDPFDFPVASRNFEYPIINMEYWRALEDHFRSPHLWQLEEGTWKLRYQVE